MGYGNTDDAHHITSPDPEAAGIARAIRQAVEEGGVKPEEGLYINAHGTSPSSTTPPRTLGFKRALGEEARAPRTSSSTKSMTGHMIGATGAVEAWLRARAGERRRAAHDQLSHPRPECDLDYTPNEAKECQLTWALSTILGFGGHNAALALRAAGRE